MINEAHTTADREIVTSRVFDAPRELVFQAWTKPEHIVNWWGPKGFSTKIFSMDVRPGGVWRLVMRGPDGRDYHNHIVFLEVVEPERLVFKHEPDADCEPVNFQTTVLFDAVGTQTKVTMTQLFPAAEIRNLVIEKYGALEGAQQTFQRLADLLATMAQN